MFKKIGNFLLIGFGTILIGFGAIAILVQVWNFFTEVSPTFEASSLIKATLKDPDSAYFRDKEVRYEGRKDDSTYYIVSMDAFAKNSFGATLRESYCVTFHIKDGDKKQKYWTEGQHIKRCSNPPTHDEIEIIKQMHGLP